MLKIEHSFLFDEVMKDKEKKIEEVEDKLIEKIATSLYLVAKEIYQKELENKLSNRMPSRDFDSVFCLNSKIYERNKNQ